MGRLHAPDEERRYGGRVSELLYFTEIIAGTFTMVECYGSAHAKMEKDGRTGECNASGSSSSIWNGSIVILVIGVAYPWGGVRGKLLTSGSSFNLGSAIPVAFQLTGAASGVTNATARLYLARVVNGVVGTEFAAYPNGNSNSGNLFRYDSKQGQYLYNLNTEGLSEGVYQLPS